jgi:hypothetical protein
MFLTPEQLHDLTGYVQPAAQPALSRFENAAGVLRPWLALKWGTERDDLQDMHDAKNKSEHE